MYDTNIHDSHNNNNNITYRETQRQTQIILFPCSNTAEEEKNTITET